MENREYQKVLEYLLSLFETGGIQIGEKLPTERKLAESLSVGRNSAREALKMLENMGVIESRQGSGNFLVGNLNKSISLMLELMLRFHQTNWTEICAFRKNMDKAICRAILEENKHQKAAISLQKVLESWPGQDIEKQIEADRTFHRVLLASTENRLWINLFSPVMELYRKWVDAVLHRVNEADRSQIFESHKTIVAALQAGDEDALELAVNRHYELVENTMEISNSDKIRPKAVLFDMDGTILNTLEDLRDSTNAVLQQFGYPTHTLEEIRTYVGNGIRKLVQRALPIEHSLEEEEKVYDAFCTYYAAHSAEKTKAYEGILPLLSSLRAEGIYTAVVSNKADFAVQPLAERYFPGLFDIAIGERAGYEKKPAPDLLLLACEKLGVEKEDILYVGDSLVDLAAARNTGVRHILVTYGYEKEEVLRQAGAEALADSPKQLQEMILGNM